MRKKCFLLALVTMLFHLCANAYVEPFYPFWVGNICYMLTDGYYEVKVVASSAWSSHSYSGNIVIPSTVTYEDETFKVVALDNGAFENCKELVSVVISEGVRTIGWDAFRGCSKLVSVEIPNSITVVGGFQDCTSLKSVKCSDRVTAIGSYAFYGCSSLDSFEIPSGVTTIGDYAFAKCTGLTSIEIPNSVTRIYERAFEGCTHLASIEFPNSVLTVGEFAFDGCELLSSIVLSENMTHIYEYTFCGCTELSSISIPNSVKYIYPGAFQGCSNLDVVEIGSSVIEIYDGAFGGCNNITDVICYGSVPPNSPYSDPAPALNPFTHSVYNTATLHVYKSYIEEYKKCQLWDQFRNIVPIEGVEKYKITYFVDGEEYTSYEVDEGDNVKWEPEPSKEGYTFSGWSYIPSTMPGNDVTVYGTFTVNKYKLTYMIDGTEYKTIEVEYGSTITPEDNPTMDGYNFSGWSDIPETMPANDVLVTGTFTYVAPSVYTVTYLVDGDVYVTTDYNEGESIVPESEPQKEGYTFSGWSWIPSKMPDEDVTITGTFTINTYTLTYMVDGAEYKSYDMKYGSDITPESEPSKEGYIFSGWSEIPQTMPAGDVTVSGTFTKGTYTLTYIVNGETYRTYFYGYDDSIIPLTVEDKEGYTFSGWDYEPAVMPGHDVTVTGSYIVNKYKLTYIVDGEVYMTIDVEYGSTITPEDEPTKDGYVFSGWSWIPSKMPAEDVTVSGTFKRVGYNVSDNIYILEGDEATFAMTNITSGDLVISPVIVVNNNVYNVTAVAGYSCMNNTGITSVTIPDGVSLIGDNAFYGCTGVRSLSLGSDVGHIGDKAFAYIGTSSSARNRAASEPLVIECHATSVPNAQYDSFEGVDLDNVLLKVDDALVDAYKNDPRWNIFTNIVGFNAYTGIHAISSGKDVDYIFSMDGRRIDKPQKGMNIIRTSKGVRKVFAK